MVQDAEEALFQQDFGEFDVWKSLCLFNKSPRRVDIASINVLRADEATHFTEPARRRLEGLLRKHDDRFAPAGPPTTQIEHRIDTGDHRLPPAKKEALKKEVASMLDAQVIEECESGWDPRGNGPQTRWTIPHLC